MAQRRKTSKAEQILALRGRRVETSVVPSPYGVGFDRPERVVDPLTLLHRRHIITDEQLRAGEHYRTAVEACPDSLVGTLGRDQVGHQASWARTPLPRQIAAAAVLHETSILLGRIDAAILRVIVAEGETIPAATAKLFGRTGKLDLHVTGARLKDALALLAETWWGKPKPSAHRTHYSRPPDAVPTAGEAGELPRSEIRTAHATTREVTR